MNNIYEYIKKIEVNYLFLYLTILLISIFIFSNIKLKKNFIISIIFGLIICFFLNEKNRFNNNNNKDILDGKIKKININNKNIYNYPDFINFLYFIIELKEYNYETFENIVKNIDSFLEIYRNIKKGVKLDFYDYDIAVDKKRNALNSLHSLILNIDNENIIEKKLNNSLDLLKNIFYKYEFEMIKICNRKIKKNGLNKNTKIININDKYPLNYFDNKKYTYDLY